MRSCRWTWRASIPTNSCWTTASARRRTPLRTCAPSSTGTARASRSSRTSFITSTSTRRMRAVFRRTTSCGASPSTWGWGLPSRRRWPSTRTSASMRGIAALCCPGASPQGSRRTRSTSRARRHAPRIPHLHAQPPGRRGLSAAGNIVWLVHRLVFPAGADVVAGSCLFSRNTLRAADASSSGGSPS